MRRWITLLLLVLLPLQFVWAGTPPSRGHTSPAAGLPCPMAMDMTQPNTAAATDNMQDTAPACCDTACPDMLSCALGHPAVLSGFNFTPPGATFALLAATLTPPTARTLPPLFRPPISSRPG